MAWPIGFETGRGMRRLIGSAGNDAAPLLSAWFVVPSSVPGTTGASVGCRF
jgi:hypothetical protein